MRPRCPLPILLLTATLAADGHGRPGGPPASPSNEARLQGLIDSRRMDGSTSIWKGPPERIGFQHGYCWPTRSATFSGSIKPYFKKSIRRDWAFYREAAEKMLWPRIDDEYRREIDGIVAGLASKGVAADRWDLVALNANEELPYYYVPWLDRRGRQDTHDACPRQLQRLHRHRQPHQGRPDRHGAQRLDQLRGRHALEHRLRHQAGGRLAHLMDGLPGVIASDDDFGVTSAGMHDHRDDHHPVRGLGPGGQARVRPRRKAMQYSRSIDDFVRIMLDGNNGGYANDWLIGDNKTGEIALFELGLKKHSVRRTRDGCLLRGQLPCLPSSARKRRSSTRTRRTSSPNARKARWEQLMAEHKGKIDIELGKRFETDDFDVILSSRGQRADALRPRRDLAARRARVGLGPVLPGRHRAVEGDRRTLAERMAFWAEVGHHGSDFLAEPFLELTPNMRGCGDCSRI